ncbi:hypothetical protein SAMN05421821_1103 [Mucilaginibacter lappiensis]|uniref:Uncharacterized protein n=1 Tax=Mucilaginibacter lappiensis TaxID=354630 RepID=A0A1N7CSQ4_9SPHI|nr:hypothetical protein [Mucilaginibacter lappiensis]SIR66494.1 hypothetical protein SAMN05421821_1103 [Mucilaginibacter lappiensis]
MLMDKEVIQTTKKALILISKYILILIIFFLFHFKCPGLNRWLLYKKTSEVLKTSEVSSNIPALSFLPSALSPTPPQTLSSA